MSEILIGTDETPATSQTPEFRETPSPEQAVSPAGLDHLSGPTRPTTSVIATERLGLPSEARLALTETVRSGSLPFVWKRWPDLPRGFEFPKDSSEYARRLQSFLPLGARILRLFDAGGSASLLAEGAGYSIVLEITPSGPDVAVAASSYRMAREIGESVVSHFESPDNIDIASMRTWRRSPNGSVSTSTIDIPTMPWTEVRGNYPEPTKGQLDSLMKLHLTDPGQGRLILWHGDPGTGKSSAIRSLFREWSRWCSPELVTDPEAAFGDPEYLFELMERSPLGSSHSDNRWRVIVAEDADLYLQPDRRLRDNPALDRLLNLTDGLLGQSQRIIVLLTTNSDVKNLNPALIRPGRCLAVVGFNRFDAGAAREWLGGRSSRRSGSVTLAELYEESGLLDQVGGLGDGGPTGQYL